MTFFVGKDLVESNRRFAVMQSGYGTLLYMIGAPALLVVWYFRQHDWFCLVLAAILVVISLVCVTKCIVWGSEWTPCDCAEKRDRP